MPAETRRVGGYIRRTIGPMPRQRGDYDWRCRAACRSEDPELFFPLGEPRDSAAARRQVEAAKAVCRRCPVVSECLARALEVGERFGIFGGVTSAERDALRQARAGPATVHR